FPTTGTMIKRLNAPYAVHPFFAPPDEKARIWRYMDFTKFVSLLDTGALFFCRADQVSDSWEGAHTVENLRRRSQMLSAEKFPERDLGLSEVYRSLRRHTFLNCWHLSAFESVAMWKLYVAHSEGIAIQATFGGFKTSFEGDENNLLNAYIGK